MRERILELLNSPEYKGSTVEDLFNDLGLSQTNEFSELVKTLNILDDESIIVQSKKGKYFAVGTNGYYKGIINLKDKGFGFIKCEGFEEDFYVSKLDVADSNNNDEVIFRIKDDSKVTFSSERTEAVVVKVSNRGLKKAVGEVTLVKDKYFLKDIDISNKVRICIEDLSYAVVGDIVQVEITDFKNKSMAYGKVTSVIGNKNDVGVDIAAIAVSHDFNLQFNDNVINEVKNIKVDYEKEYQRRVDYTSDLIITIDGEDAKDLDDAISLTVLENGNYLLGVFIADVSYYVTKGSAIDKEAYNRGTSVYLVDRVIPMLPHKLCNDLCSLNPHEKKLVLSCIMEIDRSGNVVNQSINEGFISSKYRMTYTDCNKMLEDNDVEIIEKYSEVYPMLLDMYRLSRLLHSVRNKRGSLDFDVPEGKIIVNESGEVVDVVLRERGTSERIIEEFMLLANETVASTINHLDLPFIYRVHDSVNLLKLKDLQTMFNICGYKFNIRNKIHVKEVQKLLSEIKDEDAYLKTQLLRLMAKAVYQTDNIGHFGLASSCYTHFTSPIRRYPDLIVHRLLRKYLFNYDINGEELDELLKELDEISLHSSQKERDSVECEWEVEDLKKAEYMEKYIGCEFEGAITSVTSFGIFVTLPNTIEGLIHISELDDDYYEFIPSLKTLIGVRNKRKLSLGNKVKVIVSKANKKTREINFKLVYNKRRNEKPSKEKTFHKPKKDSRKPRKTRRK